MFELENVNCGILKIDALRASSQPLTVVHVFRKRQNHAFAPFVRPYPLQRKISFEGKAIAAVDPVAYRRSVTMLSQTAFITGAQLPTT